MSDTPPDDTRAVVITVSDGVSAGLREDLSGSALEGLLVDKGFTVDRMVVADEVDEIAGAIKDASSSAQLVVTTGGTGFSHRDVTPEATASVLEKEAPGLVHAMLAGGLEKTPMAALTRARAGSIGGTLVINVPGSPRGATESLEAVLDVIPHAIQL
ncbi:MAG: MogA/MoaB family molybdenum cofactor biosynthesis protein, partial [Actinobacteria bacterium]|nr:MogA/MoaB family molybdenum cofactor biosynthesis protein [Actinomycetota bacterium]